MIIYKITNLINNKVYIGKTTKTIQWRFNKHLKDSYNNPNTTIHIQRAILKYGENNFKIEEIDKASSLEELNQKEKYWIAYYNSQNEGYNMTSGGDGGDTYASLSEEEMNIVRKKIGSKNKGIKNGQSKQVKCKSIKTNEEIFFDTIHDCIKYFGVRNKSFVQNRVEGECKWLYKNEWMFAYKDKDYPKYEIYDSSTKKGTKVKLIKDGNEYIFNSKNKAIEFIGSSKKNFKKDLVKLDYQIIYL